MKKYYSEISNPLGNVLLVADEDALIGLFFVGQRHQAEIAKDWIREPKHPVFVQTQRELQQFVEGKLHQFTVPLRFYGTPFQKSVWQIIHDIPLGKTITYSDIARKIGKELASRAVGAATGRNPISWIVPCHRVMGKDGSLTGYAGGVERKKALLNFESAISRGESVMLAASGKENSERFPAR